MAGGSDATRPPSGQASSPEQQLFERFFGLLEDHGIRHVILAGHEDYPQHIGSDVDFMVGGADFDRLTTLIANAQGRWGARLIQTLHHEVAACYHVLALQLGPRVHYLHPDAASDYVIHARTWLKAEEVLQSRRRSPQGFWIPAAAVEFDYYLVKRIAWKGSIGPVQFARLARSFAEDTTGGRAVLQRRVGAELAPAAEHALRTGDASWFSTRMASLQVAVRSSRRAMPAMEGLARAWSEARRVVQRIRHPSGLVVAVLGPDGSGKSTVLEHLAQQLQPAFRRVERHHLRPRLESRATGASSGPVTTPHAQAPRGRLAGAAKCLFFLADLTLGWATRIAPSRMRSRLVLFDRYVHDLPVDPRRYRLPENFAPARWLTRLAPKPDLWLVLIAEPATLVARKGELTPQAASILVSRYRALAASLDNAVCISTEGTLEQTCERALAPVLDHLAQRCAQRVTR